MGAGLGGHFGPLSNFLIAGAFSLVALFLPLDQTAKTEIGMAAVNGAAIFGAGFAPALFIFPQWSSG